MEAQEKEQRWLNSGPDPGDGCRRRATRSRVGSVYAGHVIVPQGGTSQLSRYIRMAGQPLCPSPEPSTVTVSNVSTVL